MNTDQKGKKIGRKRRVTGWMLLTLGLLVAAVWVVSGWWYSQLECGPYGFYITEGTFSVSRTIPRKGPTDFTKFQRRFFGFKWLAHDTRTRYPTAWYGWLCCYGEETTPLSEVRVASVALWPIPLLLWTPAALLLRSGIIARRRAITGKCKKCGYDLAGLAEGSPCPECGRQQTSHG